MKKQIFVMCYIFLSINIANSQSVIDSTTTYTIKGSVADSLSDKGIPYATISVLKDSISSNYAKRLVADADGKFEFEVKLPKSFCLLVIEATGKQTEGKAFDLQSVGKTDVGKILLKDVTEQLQGVTISAVKPLVTHGIDRIGYDVEQDPDSKTNTAIEMLRKVPMVTVDNDDEIKVKGSTSFKIYLNGKPSNMITKNPKDVLKSIPASSIKKIEVITEPGAKYDAEGVSAILNIVMQSALQGYTGSIRTSIDTRGRFGAGGYLSSKIGKLGITVNYNYNQYNTPFWTENHQQNFNKSMPYQFSDSYSESNYDSGWQWGNLELSYEFDSLNLISASLGVNGGKYKINNHYLTRHYYRDWDGDTISAYNSSSSSTNSNISLSGNIDYQRTFKKPEQLLTLSYLFDLSPSNNSTTSMIELNDSFPNLLNPKEINQKYTSFGKSDEHTFQLDYTDPFDSAKHVIEAGIKYILRINNSDNDYKLFNPITNAYDLDTLRDKNNMLYYQHIFGAYASYTFKLKTFSLRIGGRLEGTKSDVRFTEHPERDFITSFLTLIPSISISWKPKESTTLRLSYTNGISRPSIYYLNPYINDSDPYNISYGNPSLQPERSHNTSFSYGLVKQKFNMSISLSSATVFNSIENTTKMQIDVNGDTTGVYVTTYENIGHYQRFGTSMYINYNPIKWLRVWVNLFGSYSQFRNNDYAYDNFGGDIWLGAQFTLPWKLRFNAGGGGATPWSGYKYRGSIWYNYYFSLQRSFLKGDKLTLGINSSNLFEKYRYYTNKSWDDNVYETTSKTKQISRIFRFSINWRFGEMKAEIKKADRGISNDDLKAGKNESDRQ
jgi:outer membrane receptor protein involved in Fe transport